MNIEDVKGLKYYVACAALLIGMFTYSGMVGWKWFNPTSTEEERPEGGQQHRTHGTYFRYHK